MAQVLDLRGRQLVRDRTPILLDPTGGRARVLAWVGRGVALVFLIWLIGLVFAGLGLLPSGDLPLGRALVGQSPPALKASPRITQPSSARLSASARTAVAPSLARTPAHNAAATAGHATFQAGATTGASTRNGVPSASTHRHAPSNGTASNGQGASTGGTVAATPVPASHPNNGLHAVGSGPGRAVSQSSPGHTSSSVGGTGAGSGQSAASSGRGHQSTTTSSTSPGKSGTAPGHTATR